jgi:DNA primase
LGPSWGRRNFLLYREGDVRKAIALGEVVLLVESESSVDALTGHYATTWPGGASSVQIGRLTSVLGGYERLVVIPDVDPAGLAALDTLRAAGRAPHVIIAGPGEDARDLLSRVGRAEFELLVNAALAATPTSVRRRAS